MKIVRNPKLEGEKIIIASDVTEMMTEDEFKNSYAIKIREANGTESQLDALKSELRNFDGIDESPEVVKMKEVMENAKKLQRKEDLQKNIKKLEKKVIEDKEELEKFIPIVQKLNKKK